MSFEGNLSKDKCNCLKGVFAMVVLLHHLKQHSGVFSDYAVPSIIFQAMGYLSVAGFFFISGYGLAISWQKKGKSYIDKFVIKRILPFSIIIIIFSLLFYIVKKWLGYSIPRFFLINSLFNISSSSVITNGWYLQVQLMLYLFFFFVYRFIKHKQYLVVFMFCLLYVILGKCIGLSTTKYESVFAFPLGLLLGNFSTKIDKWDEKCNKYCVLAFIGFGVMFVGSIVVPNDILKLLCKIMSSIMFVLFVVCIIQIINIINRITSALGRISLEIYVIQGIFLLLFHSSHINIPNGWVYCLVVIICTLISSFLFHPISQKIYKSVERI